MNPVLTLRRLRRPALFVLVLLTIEFLDEFVFGAQEAAWPMIRDDLHLTYFQIGLLFSIPGIVAAFIEPALGILGDVWRRRVIILSGGIGFGVACFLMATSHSFIPLLLATILFFPSSGAFVALSQSTLMDHDPARHEHNMARWTFAGSVGVVGGSLVLGAMVAIVPLAGWRVVLMLAGLLTVVVWLILYRLPTPTITNGINSDDSARSFMDGVRDTVQALRRREVLRWLTLLQFSELMLDILHGYIALYFVDVVGTHESYATLAVAVWSGVGLVGDFLLIPLLERVRGLDYLRVSAAIEFILFPAFLLAPGLVPKLAILGLLGFFNAGWYSVLQGQLYSAMPGQSGAVLAIDNVAGLVGRILPFGIGLAAEHLGLGSAMWLFLLGPLVLLIGLPHRSRSTDAERVEVG